MNNDLLPAERTYLKLLAGFEKRVELLKAEGNVEPELEQILDTGKRLADQLEVHAANRKHVREAADQLKTLVRDNAVCPQCHSASMLKLIGTEANEHGWVSNRYKCRKCNINFTWNAPNNPGDMVRYVEHLISKKEAELAEKGEEASDFRDSITSLRNNLDVLKPLVERSEEQTSVIKERDVQMAELVDTMTRHLMIQKIRLQPPKK